MAATPKQPSHEEVERLLTQKGTIFEMEEVILAGRKQRVWKNTPPTFRSFLSKQLAKWGPRVMISSPLPEPSDFAAREHVTYAEMYIRSMELAAWLREQGVGHNTRVAIGGMNSTGWVASFIAVYLAGGCPVLLNSTLQPDVQIHCLALTQPKLVLVDSKAAEALGPIAGVLAEKGVGRIYCWSSVQHLDAQVRGSIGVIPTCKPHPQSVADIENGTGLEELGPESDGMVLFTSGTTNMPKAVLATQRQCLHHVISGSVPAARATLRGGGTLEMALDTHNPPPEQPVMLLAVPLFHVTGNLGWMIRAILMGVKMVYMRRWNVDDAIDLMLTEKVGLVGGVAAIANAILQSPRLPKNWPMQGVTYGGAPPPKRMADDIKNTWPEAFNVHAYGMTETLGIHTGFGGQDYIDRPDAVGRVQMISDMKVVDPDTRKELPVNQMGLLYCRGSNIMKEYINNPKATAEAIDADGWLNTGDMASIDEEGFLYIRDRAKDIIIRGGENIASAEVENVIFQDDRIAEVAAVPVPDERMGEVVGVAVSLAPGAIATPEDIRTKALPHLRRPAHPVIVVILPVLPRNANGKIVKSECKEIVVAEWKKQGGAKATAKL